MQEAKNLRIVILTGLSGSGKSTASRALEDMGFFCVDNLPVVLLPKLVDLSSASLGEYSKIALVMDLREREFLRTYPEVFSQIRKEGPQLEILFLEASDEVLVRRYSETRRSHPLADGVVEGIRKEREMLAHLRSMATVVMDTSTYNVHQLQVAISELFGQRPLGRRMALTFLSFGYSQGIPQEADLVMDVRFLSNPYFVEELKDLPGTDSRIHDFLLGLGGHEGFYFPLAGAPAISSALVRAGGKGLSDGGPGMYRGEAPVGGRCRGTKKHLSGAVPGAGQAPGPQELFLNKAIERGKTAWSV